MPSRRFADRLSKSPGWADYAGAAALAGAVGTCRIFPHMDGFDPGLLLAVVALAGVFGGTRPAILAAATGLTASFLALAARAPGWPEAAFAAEFALISALVIAAIGRLRLVATEAASAQAHLVEVFRQIPASAAIIEAPDGHLLMRSVQSDSVIGSPTPPLKHWNELAAHGGLHPDGRRFAAGDYPIVRALRTGEVVPGERFRYRRGCDDVIDLEVHAGPVYDPAGRIVAAVGMAFDVSERAQIERDLRDSEQRCRAIAERLHAAVEAGEFGLWECDLAIQTFRLDGRMAAMLGLQSDAQELSRPSLAEFVDPDGLVGGVTPYGASAGAPGLYANEVQVRTPAGQTRWLVTRGAAVGELGKVIGVATDVTERHRREEALEAALEANDVLMREADHRIKNSLQLVGSLLRLQQSRVDDPFVLNTLAEAIGRVDAIATAHLALQRSSDLKTIAIDSMLHDLCGRLGVLNPAVKIQCAARSCLTLDAEQAIPLGLIANELLTNAMRHAYAPGEEGEAVLVTRLEDGELLMQIRDGGVGLAADVQRRGLGSSVVASLARKIGATVSSAGRPGEGTTVAVRLPLGTAAGATVDQDQPRAVC